MGQRAGRALHARMLAALLRAPLGFFDATPLGRLLNLFTKDVYTCDEELPQTVTMYFSTLTSCTATVATIAIVTPWFLAVVVPLARIVAAIRV